MLKLVFFWTNSSCHCTDGVKIDNSKHFNNIKYSILLFLSIDTTVFAIRVGVAPTATSTTTSASPIPAWTVVPVRTWPAVMCAPAELASAVSPVHFASLTLCGGSIYGLICVLWFRSQVQTARQTLTSVRQTRAWTRGRASTTWPATNATVCCLTLVRARLFIIIPQLEVDILDRGFYFSLTFS